MVERGSWLDGAWRVIRELDKSLPADMPFDERVKAVKAAYPFGERRYHPYKMWLKAQRQYLCRFKPDHETKRFPLSPLERMMERASR